MTSSIRGSARHSLVGVTRGTLTLLIAAVCGGGFHPAHADVAPRGTNPGIPPASIAVVDEAWDLARPNGEVASNAASLTRRSRAAAYHDFLRVIWVPPGLRITTVGKPRAKRAFFTASSFLSPPATVDQVVSFVGASYREGQDLALMVCRPPVDDVSVTQPILATWPKVLPLIKNDLGDCEAGTLTPGEQEICVVAGRYRDRKFLSYTQGLKQTLDLAAQLFATELSRNALWDDFSIGNAFSGLGFTVWGSSTPDTPTTPLTAGAMLQRSVVPEYLLRNVTLPDGNCRCVQVPESESLHKAPVDPVAIWAAGRLDDGACRQFPALP
ncbi:MAG: hypothetical protein U1E83_04770 [Methylotetracoccus sp.]